jgi:UDP-2-acetamido-3-amino-2,3-dideoxy-glucuronate N-acetyltransferase
MLKKKPRVAILGCGSWGRNHVRNFYELGHLQTVCDTDELLLKKMAEAYPGICTETNLDELLKDPEISGLVIATPAVTHYELASRAIANGKDVFVEKPIALKVSEASDLVSLAEQSDRILMVGHILQYHPAILKLKQLIDKGELGKIQYLYSNRLNIGKIRAEENILWSFAPHDISVIIELLGEEPESVYATGGSYLQEHIPDTTITMMNFPSGVKAHIFVSWLHPFKEQKLVVVGDRKMAVFDDVSKEKLLLYPHEIQWLQRIPVAAKSEPEVVPLDTAEPLKAECKHFIDCIINRAKPRTDGKEGLRVLRVLDAAQQSLNLSGRMITLGNGRPQAISLSQPSPPTSSSLKEASVEPAPVPAANNVFVHDSSYVDEGVSIGSGTRVWHFSHIIKGSRIGDNCSIGQNVVIGPDVTVGNGCKIQNNVSLYKGVTLEDFVFCGPSLVFTNVFNPRSQIPRMNELRTTLVRKGATLGANSTIVCGVTIGRYAFIGAGAVVTKDVPDHALVMGSPARIAGWICECGEKLDWQGDHGRCSCGKSYGKGGSKVKLLE